MPVNTSLIFSGKSRAPRDQQMNTMRTSISRDASQKINFVCLKPLRRLIFHGIKISKNKGNLQKPMLTSQTFKFANNCGDKMT